MGVNETLVPFGWENGLQSRLDNPYESGIMHHAMKK
jgi:hypothetical protein